MCLLRENNTRITFGFVYLYKQDVAHTLTYILDIRLTEPLESCKFLSDNNLYTLCLMLSTEVNCFQKLARTLDPKIWLVQVRRSVLSLLR